MSSKNALVATLTDIDRLPPFPTSAARVIELMLSGTPAVAELSQIIKHDQSLTLTVLRHANSARYGRPGKEFGLEDGIRRLGDKAIIKIVLAQIAHAMFDGSNEAYGLRSGELSRGAVGGALASEWLAKECSFFEADLCFLSGLLRDVGKLAIDVHLGDTLMDRIGNHEGELPFVEFERAALGIDHAAIGAELAVKWNIPARIADAIRFHHDPPDVAHDPLFDIVHGGDGICRWAGLGIGHDGLQHWISARACARLSMDKRTAERGVLETRSRMREFEEAGSA